MTTAGTVVVVVDVEEVEVVVEPFPPAGVVEVVVDEVVEVVEEVEVVEDVEVVEEGELFEADEWSTADFGSWRLEFVSVT